MKIPLPALVFPLAAAFFAGAFSAAAFFTAIFLSSFPFSCLLSHWGLFPYFHRTQWFELLPEFSGATHDDHQHFFYMEMFPG